MSQSSPELPTAVHGPPTYVSIYLPIYLSIHLSSTLAKQAKTAYSHPKVYENTPQGPPKKSKNIDLEPKGHAVSLKQDPRTRKGY